MESTNESPPAAAATGRFGFGKNWQNFLRVLNEERIQEAERSLRNMLRVETLEGKSFLDVGCGSGLSSLAALRLGAKRVHSFDFDLNSVACALELRRRYGIDGARWTIERGDVLDKSYLALLGTWDIVYSWGVLHHTGGLHAALENVASLPSKPTGTLFIAIYNDQGQTSLRWMSIKAFYNRGEIQKWLVLAAFIPRWFLRDFLNDVSPLRANPARVLIRGLLHKSNPFPDLLTIPRRPRNPFRRYREYQKERGMSVFHDWIDWLGGWPFEVAKPEELIAFYESKGFQLLNARLNASEGNNELVLQRQT